MSLQDQQDLSLKEKERFHLLLTFLMPMLQCLHLRPSVALLVFLSQSLAFLQKHKNTASRQIRNVKEGSVTKHVPLVLVCILALIIVSDAISACACATIESLGQASSGFDKKAQRSRDELPDDFKVSGDPVENAKPNSGRPHWWFGGKFPE